MSALGLTDRVRSGRDLDALAIVRSPAAGLKAAASGGPLLGFGH
jgi:hypothetical protein